MARDGRAGARPCGGAKARAAWGDGWRRRAVREDESGGFGGEQALGVAAARGRLRRAVRLLQHGDVSAVAQASLYQIRYA